MSAVPNDAGSWTSLETPLSPEILDTLSLLGFNTMTPVQAGAIPLFMKSKDVVVEAVTGSGKTLAFVIPILEKLLRREQPFRKNEIGAMVITPTRELAQQIRSVFDLFVRDHPQKDRVSVGLFIGGTTTLEEDKETFARETPRILIGTPGRLDDLLSAGKASGLVNTKEFEILVMDEADRLLDMGFAQQLNSIVAKLPKQRRTGLFSATMVDGLSELVRAGLRNPVRIVVKVEHRTEHGSYEQRTPSTLHISYIACDGEQKLSQLVRLLLAELNAEDGARKFIVYFATCACVDYFHKLLTKIPQLKPYSIHSLHGQMETKRRSITFAAYSQLAPSVPAVLLCTDVASRGLDIPDVDYVIQVDPPQDPKAFSHRSGRAGRAGRQGKATVFLLRGREELYVDFLKLRKIPMTRQNYLLPDGGSVDNTTTVEQDGETKTITEPVQDPAADAFVEALRDIVVTDRDLHERGVKAYVSWVRAYSKHEANYIFRLKDIDLGRVAMGYGLLKMPKMPELKDAKEVTFTPREMDWDTYAFLDKKKEEKRKRELEQVASLTRQKTKAKGPKKALTGAWSDKREAQQKKQERRNKKQRKREYLKQQKELEAKAQETMAEEWDELAAEERRAKKAKKGHKFELASDEEID